MALGPRLDQIVSARVATISALENKGVSVPGETRFKDIPGLIDTIIQTGAQTVTLTAGVEQIEVTAPIGETRRLFIQDASDDPDTDPWDSIEDEIPYAITGLTASTEYRVHDGVAPQLVTPTAEAAPLITEVVSADFDDEVGGQRTIDWRTSGTFTTGAVPPRIRVLATAGGGSGHLTSFSNYAGSAGAGGLPRDGNGDLPEYDLLPSTTYVVEVGPGGAARTTKGVGNNGSDTRIYPQGQPENAIIIALAGVGADTENPAPSGPSGVGAQNIVGAVGGEGIAGQGFAGGNADTTANFRGAAPGGGAGGPGVDRTDDNWEQLLAGGPGYVSDILGAAEEFGRGGVASPFNEDDWSGVNEDLDGRDGYGDGGGSNKRLNDLPTRRSGKGGNGRCIIRVLGAVA